MEEMTNQVVDGIQTEGSMVSGDSFKEVIKNLMASGKCQRFNGCVIKNVNTEEMDEYVRVSLTLKQELPAFVSDDNGTTYHEGTMPTVFSSTYAIAGAMKENEELSWMANSILTNPSILNLILNGSKVDIIVQRVSAREDYVNPFTTKKDAVPTQFDHDTIIKHIVAFELGKSGQRMADRLADKLMGF